MEATRTVTTRDGRVLESGAFELKGDPDVGLGLSYDEVADKFRICSGYAGICPEEQAEKIIDAVRQFECVADMTDWVRGTLDLARFVAERPQSAGAGS